MAHCYTRRDCEIIIGDKSHIHKHEQGCYAQVCTQIHFTLRERNAKKVLLIKDCWS